MVTLVPSVFFNPSSVRDYLAEVSFLNPEDSVEYAEVPRYEAVVVYSLKKGQRALPRILDVLSVLPSCQDYNKIVMDWKDGVLSLAIAQGGTLMIANEYKAVDFTTAQYFLFLALKSLQLNPEQSVVTILSKISSEDEISLYRYFKSVDIRV